MKWLAGSRSRSKRETGGREGWAQLAPGRKEPSECRHHGLRYVSDRRLRTPLQTNMDTCKGFSKQLEHKSNFRCVSDISKSWGLSSHFQQVPFF